MGSFSVWPEKVRKVSTDFEEMQGALSFFAGQVSDVANKMGQVTSYASMKSKVSALQGNIENNKRDISVLQTSLDSVVNAYCDAEKNVIKNTTGMPDFYVNHITSIYASDGSKNSDNLKFEKGLLKNSTKIILKRYGISKIVDVGEIAEKINSEDYGSAIQKGVNIFDSLKAWKIEDKKLIPNEKGIYISATIKTGELVLDRDGYIARNREKYEAQARENIKKGDILGLFGSMSAEFVQTTGKGYADVTCKVIGDIMNTGVKTASLGLLDLSSLNAGMEKYLHVNPGKEFKKMGTAISDGVDIIVDDILPGAGKAAGKVLKGGGKVVGGVVKGGGKAVKTVGKFFGSIF